MIKRIIATFIILLIACAVSGCGEDLPRVVIYTGTIKNYRNIDIGKPYVYEGFDIESTDNGKDLILHFTNGEK